MGYAISISAKTGQKSNGFAGEESAGNQGESDKLFTQLNIFRRPDSKGLMPQPKLLKAPARLLLLTFAVSARMVVAAPAATHHVAPALAHVSRAMATGKARARQTTDYSHIEGVHRWGLNE